MKVKELLQVADYLKCNVKDQEFDLNEWKCSTVACAIGHTAHLFGKDNFEMFYAFGGDIGQPMYKGNFGFDAVAKFFNISKDLAYYLFLEEKYAMVEVPKKKVINRIVDVCFYYTLYQLYFTYYNTGINYEKAQ